MVRSITVASLLLLSAQAQAHADDGIDLDGELCSETLAGLQTMKPVPLVALSTSTATPTISARDFPCAYPANKGTGLEARPTSQGRGQVGNFAVHEQGPAGSGRYVEIVVLPRAPKDAVRAVDPAEPSLGACLITSHKGWRARHRRVYGSMRRVHDVDGDHVDELEVWFSFGPMEAPRGFVPIWFDVRKDALHPVEKERVRSRYRALADRYAQVIRLEPVAAALRAFLDGRQACPNP